MSNFLVFNHHSLPFESAELAGSAIPEFLKVCLRANNLGLSTILIDENVDKDWFRLELSSAYYWQDWYNQNNKSETKDLLRAFRSIQTRQPFFSSSDIGDNFHLFEVKLNDSNIYTALLAAKWHNSPLTSFPTREPWNKTKIEIEVNEVLEDSHINSYKTNIINIFSLSGLEEIETDLVQIRNESIQSGKDILFNFKEYFSYLELCGSSDQQLKNWSSSKTLLEQVVESLNALNTFCEKWNQNTFLNYSHECLRSCGLNHKVSGESQTVLENPYLRKEREFYLPNGRKELFENHIKIAHGFRIHFFVDQLRKKVFIGHIGAHLRLS